MFSLHTASDKKFGGLSLSFEDVWSTSCIYRLQVESITSADKNKKDFVSSIIVTEAEQAMAPHGATIPPPDQWNDLSRPQVDTTSFSQLMSVLPVSQSTESIGLLPANQSSQPHFSQRVQAERISFMDLMRGAGNGVWNRGNICEDGSLFLNGSSPFRSVSSHAGTPHLDLAHCSTMLHGRSNLDMPRVASRTMDSFCVQDKMSTGLFDSKILGPTNVPPGTTHLDLPCSSVSKHGMSNLGMPIDAFGQMDNFCAQDHVFTGPFDSTLSRSIESHSGMHGTFQDLRPSSSGTAVESVLSIEGMAMLPGKNPNGYQPSSTYQIINEGVANHYGADAVHVTPNSPSRLVVDDSGYASSESSLYDVDSDDEDDALGLQDEDNIEGHNLAASVNNISNASEQVPSTINQGDEDDALGLQDEDNIEGHNLAASSECPVNNEQVPSTINQGDANPVEDCPCINGNPFMHVMTQVTEDTTQTVPWKKRKRTPKGLQRPDCRVPKGMGPIEIALRNAPYRKTKYIFEPLLGITFDSEDEAYEFYNMYSWEVGFGIKKDSIAGKKKVYQTMREFRCLCSGSGEKSKYKTKKTGCTAMLRLHRTDDDGWYISAHKADHNHPLTETCGEKKEWFSHGKIDQRAKEVIRYLRESNVSLTRVHCFMGGMFGSMHNIPFTKRSLRAICHQIAKEQMDDDVQKTFDIFRQIRLEDPAFQFSVDFDEDKRIKTLLWINGKSRDQYKCFGDVITFDTTYCTNIYKMPFGLFVGVNNHFQSTIFGGVFMKDETIASFEWVFSEFLSLMGGQMPQTVFTDQCQAMAAALSKVWSGVVHLWCKWHVFKDAKAKLGPILYKKGSAFRKEFHRIINDIMTIEEFEMAWDLMLERYSLRDNQYLANIYKKRMKWAKAYFRGSFCARMSSTQRSESANHMLKRFVPRNCSMNQFILQFNKLLFDRNREEDRAEFDTKIFRNTRRRAWPIEEHAMTFYTSAVYDLFRKEVDKSTDYFAIEKTKDKQYDVVHVKPDKKLPWAREKFSVIVNNEGESYECECGLYQHFGVLCSHVLRVMVQLGVSEVPKAHILKRWTRKARDILPIELRCYQRDTLCMESMTYRHTYLYMNAVEVVQDGNKDLGAFDIAAKYLRKAQIKLKEYYKAKENDKCTPAINRVVMQNNYYPTDSDTGVDSGSEKEVGLGNSYGAAGSSAMMSDSELLKLRAPAFKRPAGRPVQIRKKGFLEMNRKKRKSKLDNDFGIGTGASIINNEESNQKRKTKIRCSECHILGHNAKNCKKKQVDLNEIPEF